MRRAIGWPWSAGDYYLQRLSRRTPALAFNGFHPQSKFLWRGGEPKEALHDARGIFCAHVCEACREEVEGKYRPEIFTDSDYDCDDAGITATKSTESILSWSYQVGLWSVSLFPSYDQHGRTTNGRCFLNGSQSAFTVAFHHPPGTVPDGSSPARSSDAA